MYDITTSQLDGEIWKVVTSVERTLYNGDKLTVDFSGLYSVSNLGRLRHNQERKITQPTGGEDVLADGFVVPYEGKFSGNSIELYAVMYTEDSQIYGIKISDVVKSCFSEVPEGLVIRERQPDDEPKTYTPVFAKPAPKKATADLPPQRPVEPTKVPKLNPIQKAILGHTVAKKKVRRIVRCIETKEEFKNTTEAGKAYGVSESSVYDAIKIHNGYCRKADKHFEYVELDS